MKEYDEKIEHYPCKTCKGLIIVTLGSETNNKTGNIYTHCDANYYKRNNCCEQEAQILMQKFNETSRKIRMIKGHTLIPEKKGIIKFLKGIFFKKK